MQLFSCFAVSRVGFFWGVEGAEPLGLVVEHDLGTKTFAPAINPLRQMASFIRTSVMSVLPMGCKSQIVQTVFDRSPSMDRSPYPPVVLTVDKKPDEPVNLKTDPVNPNTHITPFIKSACRLPVQLTLLVRWCPLPPQSPGVGLIGEQLLQPGSAR